MVVGLVSYAALGSLVGVAVGAVEILQRYRDAPFRAIRTPPSDASGQSDTLHLMGLAASAGFGGAALIRARLATIRLVIETLLSVVDRQLDRQLATERYHTVHELMVGKEFLAAVLEDPNRRTEYRLPIEDLRRRTHLVGLRYAVSCTPASAARTTNCEAYGERELVPEKRTA